MDVNLDVLRLAQALAAHAAQRQSLIASNVANADTPGYRAVDIDTFSTAYRDGPDVAALKATRSGHLGAVEPALGFRAFEIKTIGAESPNGNSVSIEDQMTRAVEARQAHDLAMGVYSKTLDILRLTVRRGA